MFNNKKKTSFFDKLTGTLPQEEDRLAPYDSIDIHPQHSQPKINNQIAYPISQEAPKQQIQQSAFSGFGEEQGMNISDHSIPWGEFNEPEVEVEGELEIDMYQTESDIYLVTIVAGVPSEEVDISITREAVTIRGRREGIVGVDKKNYFNKEIFWGTFSRTVKLPHEVIIEDCEATETNGILTLRLPKIDKNKQAKLKVKPKM